MFCFAIYTLYLGFFFFFQAEDGIRDGTVTGVQTCALPISSLPWEAVYENHRVGGVQPHTDYVNTRFLQGKASSRQGRYCSAGPPSLQPKTECAIQGSRSRCRFWATRPAFMGLTRPGLFDVVRQALRGRECLIMSARRWPLVNIIILACKRRDSRDLRHGSSTFAFTFLALWRALSAAPGAAPRWTWCADWRAR